MLVVPALDRTTQVERPDAVVTGVSLHRPALLLTLPVLTGAVVATAAPGLTAEPTVELAGTPPQRAEPATDCRLLPADQQPPHEPRPRRTGSGAQVVHLYVPATTCNTPVEPSAAEQGR